MSIVPRLEGAPVTVAELEAAFGPLVGAVMGYGEGELGRDGRWRWCASVLPRNGMPSFLNSRVIAMRAAGDDPRKPFLILMGSLKGAAAKGGTARALYGVGLACPGSMRAQDILHANDLRNPANLTEKGDFRWPTGVPLLRVWLSDPPMPFEEVIGDEHRQFTQADGNRVVPLDELVPGLSSAVGAVILREVVLDRPPTWPTVVSRMERTYREGHLRSRPSRLEPVRSAAARADALSSNLDPFGDYTCENASCGYQAAKDASVSPEHRASMYDVHHRVYVKRGERTTEVSDLAVLCPTCHRREHLEHREE